MSSLFSFPNPVNDKAARTVATGVVIMGLAFTLTGWGWILIPLTYGFWARVLTGPTLSPLGQLATRMIAPRLGDVVETPGPPKRFAQGIGVAFTTAASVTYLAGAHGAARIIIAGLVVAASLEAFLGLCLGCKAFAVLMRLGVIPDSVCVECGDLSKRHPELARR